MFFNSWDSLLRILVIGVLNYVLLIVMLRISGNRTLSQMNSFDFIITIAMGSTFSSGLLNKQVALVDTVAALGLLIFMQFVLTKLSVKSKTIDSLVKAEPSILFLRGKFLRDIMLRERVTEEELLAAIREDGMSSLEQVEVIVLETNGKLSAVPKKIGTAEAREFHKSYSNASGLKH